MQSKQMKMRSGEKALGLGDAIPEDIKDNWLKYSEAKDESHEPYHPIERNDEVQELRSPCRVGNAKIATLTQTAMGMRGASLSTPEATMRAAAPGHALEPTVGYGRTTLPGQGHSSMLFRGSYQAVSIDERPTPKHMPTMFHRASAGNNVGYIVLQCPAFQSAARRRKQSLRSITQV